MRSTRRKNSMVAEEARLKARALRVRCPKCRATPGNKCWARYGTGTVEFVHEERIDAAQRWGS